MCIILQKAGHFNPRAPCGARPTGVPQNFIRPTHFNPRAPCGARRRARRAKDILRDFNPRAPCGARLASLISLSNRFRFQPTRPLRGATILKMTDQQQKNYFNPRAPCGARRNLETWQGGAMHFNPRAPCGARRVHEIKTAQMGGFQPTRPLRGATVIR